MNSDLNLEDEMIAPVRSQLSRRKGWRMPANTVKVDRSTKWGNPFDFRSSEHCWTAVVAFGCRGDRIGRQQASVLAFRQWLGPHPNGQLVSQQFQVVMEGKGKKLPIGPNVEVGTPPTIDEIRAQLRGKNLACWCALGSPCHADVLLEVANRDLCGGIAQ